MCCNDVQKRKVLFVKKASVYFLTNELFDVISKIKGLNGRGYSKKDPSSLMTLRI